MRMLPDKSLMRLLERAYRCPQLDGPCAGMSWDPAAGKVPLGFFGATATPGEVRLVLILRQSPSLSASFDPDRSPLHHVRTAAERCALAMQRREDTLFRNLRTILDLCLPGQSLDRQSRQVWITACPLCRAAENGQGLDRQAAATCRDSYLLPQLSLFPSASVVALGHAAHRLMDGFVEHLTVGEPEPPACSRPGVRESWIDLGRRLNG